MAKKLTIEQAEARCPDMLKGQTWSGVAADCRFKCKNPKHSEIIRKFFNYETYGCEQCNIEEKIKAGAYFIASALSHRNESWERNENIIVESNERE